MDFLRDLWQFMKERKNFWLAPIIVILLLIGTIIPNILLSLVFLAFFSLWHWPQGFSLRIR